MFGAIYLGYDWFDAAPVGSGDGGWLDILDRAIGEESSVPEPSTLLLLGAGVIGMIARRRD